jgi:chitin disaccharide deacetylase
MTRRRLIVNADDLGMSRDVDAGILEAHERGIVTSTSLMVRRPSAATGASAAAATALSIGLHFDLSEWEYSGGRWRALYEHSDPTDAQALASELTEQLALFERVVGRAPTHLDSHQHVHREEPVRSTLLTAGARLRVPVRGEDAAVHYRGDFYGQSGTGDPYPEGISVDHLLFMIRSLPAGTTEIGCHPGHAIDRSVSSYAAERSVELGVLCDPRVRDTIRSEGIELVSYSQARG